MLDGNRTSRNFAAVRLQRRLGEFAGHIAASRFVIRVDGSPREKVTMDHANWVTEQFEASRPRLRAVAYRMLGSHAEADDAVQEAWIRLARDDPAQMSRTSADG